MVAVKDASAGNSLPTIRQLCSDLGLAERNSPSKATTKRSSTTAVVVSNGRHGTVVSSNPMPVDPAELDHRLRESAMQLALTAQQVGATRADVARWLDEALGQVRIAGA